MEPGSGGGVFTGHIVLFLPARIALTSAILSFRVRFATEGTVMGGSFGRESFVTVAAVLEAVVSGFAVPVAGVGVDVAAANAFSVAVAVVISGGPPGGSTSLPGVALASLLAAHAASAGIKLSAQRNFLSVCRSTTASCIRGGGFRVVGERELLGGRTFNKQAGGVSEPAMIYTPLGYPSCFRDMFGLSWQGT